MLSLKNGWIHVSFLFLENLGGWGRGGAAQEQNKERKTGKITTLWRFLTKKLPNPSPRPLIRENLRLLSQTSARLLRPPRRFYWKKPRISILPLPSLLPPLFNSPLSPSRPCPYPFPLVYENRKRADEPGYRDPGWGETKQAG